MAKNKDKKYASVLRFIDKYNTAENIKLHNFIEDAEKRCVDHVTLNKSTDNIYFDASILEVRVLKEFKNES